MKPEARCQKPSFAIPSANKDQRQTTKELIKTTMAIDHGPWTIDTKTKLPFVLQPQFITFAASYEK